MKGKSLPLTQNITLPLELTNNINKKTNIEFFVPTKTSTLIPRLVMNVQKNIITLFNVILFN